MTESPDYDALAAELTNPAREITGAGPALRGSDAEAAGRDFLLREFGSEEAIDEAMRQPGRPRVGDTRRGPSPVVRGALTEADFTAFKALERRSGKKQSELVREAVHKLLVENKLVS